MNQQPTILVVRRAPYIFLVALVAMLVLFIWVPPMTKILVISGASGLAAFLAQRASPRIGQDHVPIISLILFLFPGMWVTNNEFSLALALYACSFFVVESGLHWLWNGVRRARGVS